MKRKIILSAFLAATFLTCVLLINILPDIPPTQSTATTMQSGRTVIIDAGHGGVDGGAVSADGIVEKHINLSIAVKLKMLCEIFGYNVIMTREDDISIHDADATTIKAQKTSDLHNRLKIANEYPNAILISIHQNKFQSASSKGMQVFYSSNDAGSKLLAEAIQSFTKQNLMKDNERVIKPITKSVYLIYNAKQPAVLVECGFLSNREEAKLLNDEEYQQKIAFCIFGGLQEYYS